MQKVLPRHHTCTNTHPSTLSQHFRLCVQNTSTLKKLKNLLHQNKCSSSVQTYQIVINNVTVPARWRLLSEGIFRSNTILLISHTLSFLPSQKAFSFRPYVKRCLKLHLSSTMSSDDRWIATLSSVFYQRSNSKAALQIATEEGPWY